ncbi:MAG: desulfoferrodoxin family protein [Actinomycetota bacterium]
MRGFDLAAYGSSTKGPDSSIVYAYHRGMFVFKTEKSETLLASSYCNIHGLWQSSVELELG